MGCCVSKCRPEYNYKPSPQEQDKLPISQTPPTLYSSTKISPSPPSPTSSTSSFTCTTTSNTISSASSLSTASSSLSSKERSFSNDFLWSCYKDNPHISRINSLRDASLSLHMQPTKHKPKPQHHRKVVSINPSPPKPNYLAPLNYKQSPPPQSFPMPQKRMRSNSPTNLTRQKSFRKDTDKSITINYASNLQSRTLIRSPSPSTRFNGDKSASPHNYLTTDSNRIMNSSSKVSGLHSNSHYSGFSSTRKLESVKAASPNNNCSRRVLHSGLRNSTETCTLGVSPKVDETVVKDVMSDHNMDLTLMEDIDNPLISLDCFIFL